MASLPGERLVPSRRVAGARGRDLCALLLGYTRLGRHAVAIGSNEHTARLCGVPVAQVRLVIYTLRRAVGGSGRESWSFRRSPWATRPTRSGSSSRPSRPS